MSGRVLDVNAHTVLDCVEAAARGPDWADEGLAVVDVRTPDGTDGAGDRDDGVVLELELDETALDHVAPHADRVSLGREQALTLADALVAATEAAGNDERGQHVR